MLAPAQATMATREQPDILTHDAPAVAAEEPPSPDQVQKVKARGYWELVWIRFKRDRMALGSIGFLVLLIAGAFGGAPLATKLLGHGPEDLFPTGIDERLLPVGPWSWVEDIFTGERHLLILGAADTLGRDEFLRLLYGAQVSLEVAVLSTIGVMTLGTLMGSIAGYFGGWIDTLISRLTEITMAFPALLFLVALAATVGPRLDNVTFGFFGKGVVTLVLIITLLGWFYPARIMRAQVLSIREKEYVEAARMVGASDFRIIRSHVLPHLMAPIIVYSTLIVATYILLETGLSFLGLGIKPPTASWGNLLANAPTYYTTQPWLMIWPGLAVLMTTLAFNLLGDGLRDAFDPRSGGR
jgi:peptide/nickel transport system permease protein